MNLAIKPLVLSFAALVGLALNASGQGMSSSSVMTNTPATGSAYGLLGQDYVGLSFGYTDIDSGPAKVSHDFGFIANRPTEMRNVDALFKYDHSRTSAVGQTVRGNDLAVGAVAYVPLSGFRPFIEGNVGWSFVSGAGVKSDSFTFLVGVGAEFQVLPRLALTPYVDYQEARHFNSERWTYGGKATYRFTQEWSGSLAVELDDDQNLTYRFGVQRHF